MVKLDSKPMNESETKIRSYSSTEVAKICDVHFTTVYHWISKGLLEARKTPGGHNRINEADLVAFLHKYKYPIPKTLSDRTTKRILIVEDETAQRRLLVRMIKNHFDDCEIFEATNGFEAGFMARELKPMLVILDLLLPGIHGARICRIIRQCKGLRDTKILSLTAYKVEKAKRILLKAGADAFLAKPYKNAEFIEIVGNLLGSNAIISPKSNKI